MLFDEVTVFAFRNFVNTIKMITIIMMMFADFVLHRGSKFEIYDDSESASVIKPAKGNNT
jgi:hypothetical protein